MKTPGLLLLVLMSVHCWGAGANGGTPSCAEVCTHGRNLGCSACARSTCESTCEAEFSDEARAAMYRTESCRWGLGGSDTFAQCNAPH